MSWWIGVGVIATLVVVGWIVHRGLTAADRRGWVYYRNPDRPAPRSLGMLEEIYQPSVHHVIDEETVQDSLAEHAETGEPDDDDPPHPEGPAAEGA